MSVHPKIWTFRLISPPAGGNPAKPGGGILLPPQGGVRHRIPFPMRIAFLLERGDPLGGILTHGNCGEPRLQSVERRVEVEVGHAVIGIPTDHENGRALRLQRGDDLVHDKIQVGAGHDAGDGANRCASWASITRPVSISSRADLRGITRAGAPRSSSATALPRSRVRPIWHRQRRSSRRRRRRARIRRRVHGR